jgi:hypothetical protein
MRRLLAGLLALTMGGNGLAMLVAGPWWYGAVPGVTSTGPFNPHFVQDIGIAFLVAGAGFGWFAMRAAAKPAAVAGAAFLTAHALLHLSGSLTGHHAGMELGRDFAGVYLPALIAAFVVLPETRRV